MYGTVAILRVTPGREGQLVELAREFEKEISGLVSEQIYRTDADANVYMMAVAFTSREAYRVNAASSEQHARYLKLRELLAEDPTWHDGEIVYSSGPA